MKKQKALIYVILAHLSMMSVYSQSMLTQPSNKISTSPSSTNPCSITADAAQPLNFGSFCLKNSGSSGGTITVGWDGSRTSTGDVILINNGEIASPAIFEVSLCPGRDVTITYPPIAILNGGNGGSLILNIGPTEKGESGSTFRVSDAPGFLTQLRVGGTLNIGPNTSNLGGNYNVSFTIAFNQQ